ncbi:hypothetical protein HanXRQr2_Chr17g0806121 [Helianthus annuus]|uniref:Uncharacterized protein n=1 Tax=Helianthus annuus TaxID=4232 RepID=A0A9K3DJE9_HELAN|nr:hypothetical protein HanXRQr2_Chr17g0806121 [Helianthus annuus]KAJ0429333.1 hypothetical protein HanHA300_Chr17g0656111 [Helianthus annuus]KAJ0636512.1 hypothetical protein HanOQP8_Chr17g0662741 [Helianthus annuus]
MCINSANEGICINEDRCCLYGLILICDSRLKHSRFLEHQFPKLIHHSITH